MARGRYNEQEPELYEDQFGDFYYDPNTGEFVSVPATSGIGAPEMSYYAPEPTYYAPEPTYYEPTPEPYYAPPAPEPVYYAPPAPEPAPTYYEPAPVYYAPPPESAQTYYEPEPVYYAPPPAPEPVYYAPEPPPAPYYAPELVYYAPPPAPEPVYYAPEPPPVYVPPPPAPEPVYYAPEPTPAPVSGIGTPAATYYEPTPAPYYAPPSESAPTYYEPEPVYVAPPAPEPVYVAPQPEPTYTAATVEQYVEPPPPVSGIGSPQVTYVAPEPTPAPAPGAQQRTYSDQEPEIRDDQVSNSATVAGIGNPAAADATTYSTSTPADQAGSTPYTFSPEQIADIQRGAELAASTNAGGIVSLQPGTLNPNDPLYEYAKTAPVLTLTGNKAHETLKFQAIPGEMYRLVVNGQELGRSNTPDGVARLVTAANQISQEGGSNTDLRLQSEVNAMVNGQPQNVFADRFVNSPNLTLGKIAEIAVPLALAAIGAVYLGPVIAASAAGKATALGLAAGAGLGNTAGSLIVGKPLDQAVISGLTTGATVLGGAALGPVIGAGSVGVGAGAAGANLAANLAQGKSLEDSLKSAAIAGVAAGVMHAALKGGSSSSGSKSELAAAKALGVDSAPGWNMSDAGVLTGPEGFAVPLAAAKAALVNVPLAGVEQAIIVTAQNLGAATGGAIASGTGSAIADAFNNVSQSEIDEIAKSTEDRLTRPEAAAQEAGLPDGYELITRGADRGLVFDSNGNLVSENWFGLSSSAKAAFAANANAAASGATSTTPPPATTTTAGTSPSDIVVTGGGAGATSGIGGIAATDTGSPTTVVTGIGGGGGTVTDTNAPPTTVVTGDTAAPGGTEAPPTTVVSGIGGVTDTPPVVVTDIAPGGTEAPPTAVVGGIGGTEAPPVVVTDTTPGVTEAPPTAVVSGIGGTEAPPVVVTDTAPGGTDAPGPVVVTADPTPPPRTRTTGTVLDLGTPEIRVTEGRNRDPLNLLPPIADITPVEELLGDNKETPSTKKKVLSTLKAIAGLTPLLRLAADAISGGGDDGAPLDPGPGYTVSGVGRLNQRVPSTFDPFTYGQKEGEFEFFRGIGAPATAGSPIITTRTGPGTTTGTGTTATAESVPANLAEVQSAFPGYTDIRQDAQGRFFGTPIPDYTASGAPPAGQRVTAGGTFNPTTTDYQFFNPGFESIEQDEAGQYIGSRTEDVAGTPGMTLEQIRTRSPGYDSYRQSDQGQFFGTRNTSTPRTATVADYTAANPGYDSYEQDDTGNFYGVRNTTTSTPGTAYTLSDAQARFPGYQRYYTNEAGQFVGENVETEGPEMAEGGEVDDDMVRHLVAYRKGGGHAGPGPVRGIGSGQEDKIPAWLSDGEYVWSAQDVADLGDGSTDEGVRRLDRMRQMVRKGAGRKDVKKIAKPQRGIQQMLKAVGGAV